MAISTTTTVKYLRKGDKGDQGDAGDTGRGVLATGVRYRLNASGTTPIGITAKATRDVVNETWRLTFQVTTVPNPWSSDAPVPTAAEPYLWKYSATLYTDGTLDTEGPVCIGQRGDDGNTILDSITYYCLSATATLYDDGIYANWDEGELEVMYDNSVQDNEWTTTAPTPTEEKPYLWRFSAIGYSDLTIASEGPVCIGHYGRDGQRGATGLQGPFIQYRGYWDESTIYYRQTTGNGTLVIDVVWYNDDYYECIKTNVGQNPEDDYNTDSIYWVRADYHDFVATQLLLAENAVIYFAQGQQLLLQDASGNVTAGAKGTSTSAKDIRFWAGTTGTEPDIENAPFRVYEDGSIVATDATISGVLEALQRPTLRGLPTELTTPGYYEAGNSSVATIPTTLTSSGKFKAGDIIRIYDTTPVETSMAPDAAEWDAERGMMRLSEQWDVTGSGILARDGVTLARGTSGGHVVGPLFKTLASEGSLGISTYMPKELRFFGGYVELTCVIAPSTTGSDLQWTLNATNTPVMVWSQRFSSSVGGYLAEVYYINGVAQAYYHSNTNI
jgi:hypothetical protein